MKFYNIFLFEFADGISVTVFYLFQEKYEEGLYGAVQSESRLDKRLQDSL